MKNKLKYLLTFIVGGFVFAGCLPDPAEEALLYSGPTVVEFKNHTFGMLGSVLDSKGILRAAGNLQTISSRVINVDRRETDTVFVQLIGPQRDMPTEVAFSLDATSTAVEGQDFEFLTGDRSVTIPANSSLGKIVIDPLQANLDSLADNTLVLTLEGNDQVGVATNYSTFTIRMKKL